MEIERRENTKKRAEIATIENNVETGAEELFQNDVLRPIIKMQHDLLIAYFKNYILKKKINFKGFSETKQIEYIESFLKNDLGFRSELRGLIIGQFSILEYQEYLTLRSELNKRILNIIQQRIISNLPALNP